LPDEHYSIAGLTGVAVRAYIGKRALAAGFEFFVQAREFL
jgi:hypothetical protein